MKVNIDEDLIVMLIGKNMVGEKQVTAIKIYQLRYENSEEPLDIVEVRLKYSQTFIDLKVSTEFEFKYDERTKQIEELFLIDNDRIYLYNFEK